MSKQIKADLDKVVDVIDDLKDSIFNWDEYGIRSIDKDSIRTALEQFVVEDEHYTKSEVQAMFDPLRETINRQINEIDSLKNKIDFWVSSWNYLSKKFNDVNFNLTTPTKGGSNGQP